MRRALASLLLSFGGISSAAAFDLSVEARLIGQAERLSFSHDASTFNPVLGNPTSVLEYAPTSSLWAGLSLSGRSVASDWFWFDISAAVPLTGMGEFADYDYYAGQALFSHTQSNVAVGQGIMGGVRLPVPLLGGAPIGNSTLRPYLTANVESRRLSATGLACGTVCGTLPAMPDNTLVISHDLAGWQAGAGLWLEAKISEAQTFDVRAELLAGRLGADDTHYLRNNLGPTPHIVYDFQTFGARAEVTYTHALTDNLALIVGGQAGIRNGSGTAIFGASMLNPIGRFDADFWQTTGAASIGLKAAF